MRGNNPVDNCAMTLRSRTQLTDRTRSKLKPKAKQRLIKAKGELTEEEKISVLLSLACRPYVYNPVSTEAQLTKATVHISESLYLQDTSFALVPVRIGRHIAVDSAAEAVVHARADIHNNGNNSVRTRKYLHAITCLQESLQSPSWRFTDEAILAILLLRFYERLMASNIYIEQKEAEVHKKALEAIVLHRGRRSEAEISEVMRSILYQAWTSYFWLPCSQGTASPFDHANFRRFDPPDHYNLSPELANLWKTSMRIMVRIPALIAELRNLRKGLFKVSDPEGVSLTAATREVLQWTDAAAENAALHEVQVVKSLLISSILPCSFRYRHIGEIRSTTRYWIARILICRLWLKLRILDPSLDGTRDTEDDAKTESERMLTNVMMSWDHFHCLSPYGHTYMGPSLAVAWGVLADFDKVRGVPASRFRIWALDKLVDRQTGMGADVTPDEMDALADAFVGGPLSGFRNKALEILFGA